VAHLLYNSQKPTDNMKYLFIIFIAYTPFVNAQFRDFVINECMPNNSITASDQDGEYNDWVEFYNNSTSSINVEGYFLSDRKSEPTKFRFPSQQVNPNDYLIVWLDKDTLQEGLHTNFKLSASGEQVYLFDLDTNLIDFVHFTNVAADVSMSRTFDGDGSFSIANPTFNQSNGLKQNGLVINEWMANNTNTVQDENDEFNDWIELYNNTAQSINLDGYFLSNKANEATKYRFPNLVIPPHDYLVLWADEDTLQGDLHLPFKLDSERDDIILSRPDTSTIDYFFHHFVDSNITMARIPNGLGDIALGNTTFESTNMPYLSLSENNYPEFNAFPNPCSSHIYLKDLDKNLEYIDLIDVNGRLITRFSKPLVNFKIDLSPYKNGVYFLITSNNSYHEILIQ